MKARASSSFLDVHSQKNYASVFVFLPGAFKRTGFCPARHAPRSPEINEHGFPAKIFQRERPSIEQRQCKRGSLFGDQRGLNVTRVSGKAVSQKPSNRSEERRVGKGCR